MNALGFTKGPWWHRRPDPFGDYTISHDGDTLAVAAVVSNMRPPEQVRANADLIAAAPDLYEALEIVRDADEDCRRDGLPRILPAMVRARIDAALAKANGEKP